MGFESRLKQIRQFIDRMPSLSTTVAKVLSICNSPMASANDLNRVISYDPVLTGQMLKLINSAYYGLPNRITTLARAIVMLGINTVKNMVLATSVLAGCRGLPGIGRFTINDFWAHSLCAGVLAKLIADCGQIPANEQEEYFIAGLLHDLGKLPMMACFPERYANAVDESINSKIQLVESENMHIGFNHCQIGVLIAAKWKLGSAVQAAINQHHATKPVPDRNFLISSIGAANFLANLFSIGSAGDRSLDPLFLNTHAERLGVSTHVLVNLRLQMETEIEKAKVFLQISNKGKMA